MEENQKKKQTKQKKSATPQQGTGCFGLFVLVVVLLTGFFILRLLDTPAFTGGTDSLKDNPYAPEDFALVNGYVTCTAGPTRRGLDVSAYQEDVDWAQVRDAGFDFVFIRIGYRGYSVGDIFEDQRARENLAGAKAAGLDVGVYFYAQAVSTDEALEEANWCLDFLKGEALDLPVVYDWEYVSPSARTGGMDRQTLTECVQVFCETIEQEGYRAMIYFNGHVSRDLLDLKKLQNYPFWLAQYRDRMDFPYQVDFWQYTESGTVPGIEGDVDIDLMFLYE